MIPVDRFFRRVAHVARGCPTPVLTDAVVQAAEDFCERTWLWRGEAVPQEAVADQVVYVLEPDVPDGVQAEVLVVHRVLVDGSPVSVTTPTRDQIRFWSAPRTGAEITASLVLKPARDSANLPAVLWEEWQDAIAAGARF